MLDLLQLIFTRVQQAFGFRCLSDARANRSRRFGMESLEFRRVMAATITTIEPTASGSMFELSEEVNTQGLSLYDSESQAAGAADVTLQGASVGEISGSLTTEGTRGTLPSGNGTLGGNFVTTFAVSLDSGSVVTNPTEPTTSTDPDNGEQQMTGNNVAPTGLELSSTSIPEDAAIGDTVGIFSTTGGNDADSYVYRLIPPPGAFFIPRFTIVGNELRTLAELDFETQANHIITVRATDPFGGSFERVFLIAVTNVIDVPPVLVDANATISENAAIGTTVATLSTDDDDNAATYCYTLVSGEGSTDNAIFTISGDQILTADLFDFESQFSYGIRVRSTRNDGESAERALTVQVEDVQEGPFTISLSSNQIANGQPIDTTVGTLGNDDPDIGDVFTYALVAGQGDTDNASFRIVGDQLRTLFEVDQTAQSAFSVRVRVVDTGGLSTERSFAIAVTGTNGFPTALALSSTSIVEDAPVGEAVGTLSTSDPNSGDSHVYRLVSGTGSTDNASFVIVGDQLQTATSLDFENQASYSVRIRTTDPFAGTFDQIFNLTVTDDNESPTAVKLSTSNVGEEEPSGTAVDQVIGGEPKLWALGSRRGLRRKL